MQVIIEGSSWFKKKTRIIHEENLIEGSLEMFLPAVKRRWLIIIIDKCQVIWVVKPREAIPLFTCILVNKFCRLSSSNSKFVVALVCVQFSNDRQLFLTLYYPNFTFLWFSRYNLWQAPFVYCLIDVALKGNFFHCPFLLWNRNLDSYELTTHAGQYRVLRNKTRFD